MEDQKAGVKYLVGLGFVDEERIGVMGWSYGGYMTLDVPAAGAGGVQVRGRGCAGDRLAKTMTPSTPSATWGCRRENEKGYHDKCGGEPGGQADRA